MPNQSPQRLYFRTYLAMVKNSPGSRMFREFYLRRPDGSEFEAIGDGQNACAFFVSSVLTLLGKVQGVHGTVDSTVRDLVTSCWKKVGKPHPGDVVVWDFRDQGDGKHRHIGFAVGPDSAVSTSSSRREVAEHELHFGAESRPIESIYRLADW
jgi:hypothetical protein